MRYKKTDKGHAEIAGTTRTLPQSLRNVLLLVDGSRRDTDLQNLLPGATPQTLAALRDGGYIEPCAIRTPTAEPEAPAAPVASSNASDAGPDTGPPTLPPQRRMEFALPNGDDDPLEELRTRIVRSLKRALGPASISLIETVYQARTMEDLTAVLARARLVIKNARGWRVADEFASRYGSITDD